MSSSPATTGLRRVSQRIRAGTSRRRRGAKRGTSSRVGGDEARSGLEIAWACDPDRLTRKIFTACAIRVFVPMARRLPRVYTADDRSFTFAAEVLGMARERSRSFK